jgi:hypothetical protein
MTYRVLRTMSLRLGRCCFAATACVAASFLVPSVAIAQGAMTNGENYAAAISAPGEIDEWTFTAALGDYILLSIGEVPPGQPDPDFRPWIRLRRPDGMEIGSNAGVVAAQINIAAPLSGTYTVLVRDSTIGRPGSTLGTYVLHFLKVPGTYAVPVGDEGGPLVNGANTAGRIGAAGATPTLRPADLDVWTFTAAQNDAIVLSLGEVLDSEIDPDFRPWLRLFGPNGALLGSDAGFLNATLYLNPAPLSGVYTVVVADSNIGREGSVVGDYLLHLVKTPGTAIVPAGDEGGPMTVGENHPGRIGAPGANPGLHRGDLDVWTFTAAQNDAIVLTLGEVLDSELDPEFRPWIRLFGPNGDLLGSDAGFLAATLYVNPAPLTGTYAVVVTDSNIGREGSTVGDYLLHLVKVPGTAIVPAGDEGGPMNNGATYNGRIGAPGANPQLHRGDLDVWTFGAAQSTAIAVTIGEIVPDAPDPDFRPFIRLFGPTGTLLGSATGFVTASINTMAPLTGVYTIVVADSNIGREGAIVGDYQLSAFFTSAAVPTTSDDAFTTGIDTTLTIPAPGVLANDSSNGGGALSAVLVTTVTSGTLTLNADGSFTFTPPAGFTGVASFTYRAVSASGAGNVATVAITVTGSTTVLAPTGLYASSIVGNLVTLQWTVQAGGLTPTNFVLEGGINPGEVLASIPTGSPSPIYTFVAPTGAFFVRMHALAGAIRSGPSNEIRIFVNVPTPPSAPANLLGLVNGSSIALAWRNTFGGGAPGGIVLDVTGSLTATLPLGLTDSFQFNGVPGGTYTLSLRAVNAAGSSLPSNSITLSFPAPCSGAPLPPANLLAYRIGRTVFVVWDPAATGPAPTTFVLNVSGSFVGSFGTPGRTLSGTVGPGTYQVSVAAQNACGGSAFTAAQTVVVP